MRGNKLLSKKFLMAVGTIIVTLALGFGYQLDPRLIGLLTTAESALWIVIEGIIDMAKGDIGVHSKWRSRKFYVAVSQIVILLALGFGYELDPAFVASLIGAEGVIWTIIEGLIDRAKKQ